MRFWIRHPHFVYFMSGKFNFLRAYESKSQNDPKRVFEKQPKLLLGIKWKVGNKVRSDYHLDFNVFSLTYFKMPRGTELAGQWCKFAGEQLLKGDFSLKCHALWLCVVFSAPEITRWPLFFLSDAQQDEEAAAAAAPPQIGSGLFQNNLEELHRNRDGSCCSLLPNMKLRKRSVGLGFSTKEVHYSKDPL